MTRVLAELALLSVGALSAAATQYWIAYEGDAYPEDCGWMRVYGDENGPQQGGAERSLADGILTLDGLFFFKQKTAYEIQRAIDPAPGETFVAECRVCVDPQSDPRDVGIVIARDYPPGHVSIDSGPAGVWFPDDHVAIALEPNVFHEFSLSSADMEQYRLVIDGTLEYVSDFEAYTILDSFVNFGDAVQGERSLSRWDYFRFGAVPEPNIVLIILFVLMTSRTFARASRRRR